LLSFQKLQRNWTNYLRDPGGAEIPADVEENRLAVYRELIINNFNALISVAFPVSKKTIGDKKWKKLVSKFVRDYSCNSPYFSDLPKEFLTFLDECDNLEIPRFLRELCHYEWVEFAISTSKIESVEDNIELDGDVLSKSFAVSPLAWPVSYIYPVHLIGPDYQPDKPPDNPSYFVICRDRSFETKFVQINEMTMSLLTCLDGLKTGQEALDIVLDSNSIRPSGQMNDFGAEVLARLYADEIIVIKK